MSHDPDSGSALLTIDFDAALAKLAWSQLQGSWQLPAELTRLMIARGARAVELEIEPRHIAVTAPGARLEPRTVADFASVLDRGLPAVDRHRALVDLEERDAFVLAAIASAEPRSLELSTGGDQGLRLELRGDRLKAHNPRASAVGRPDVELRIEGLAVDAERASKWLRRVGRFAGVPVAITGVRVDRGFTDALIETRLDVRAPSGDLAPLPAAIAIPRRGSAPRLWLLRHGIIATHATVPGYPPFLAAVEMAAAGPDRGGPELVPGSTAAMLRERLGPYVETLVDAAVGLNVRLASTAPDLAEEVRARSARLLLEAALKRRRLSEVSGIPAFPLVDARGRRLVSIDVISRLVRVEQGGTSALDAIPPGSDPAAFSLTGQGALQLSAGERTLLGELLRVVFQSPPGSLGRSRWRRWRNRLTDLARLRRFSRGAPVEESALSAAERTFLDRWRAAEREGALPPAAFRAGGGRVDRHRDGTLLLPRGERLVRFCVSAVAGDACRLYPAAVALLGGRELPGPELRRQWYASADAAS